MTNTFYLDMDGVIADWDSGAARVLGGPLREKLINGHYKNTDEEWIKLRNEHRMYRDLPLMPHAEILVELGRQYRDRLGWELRFLTAVPKNDDMPWAFSDKVLWALERFPDIPVFFGPHSTDKYKHCLQGDILVDDRNDNCLSWTAAGGLAVRVKSHDIRPAIQQVRIDLNQRMAKLDIVTVAIAAAGGFNGR
jgi:5'(3')-deoxyribonucleotidase